MSHQEIDPGFLKKLRLLAIISKKRFQGRLMAGGRRGRIGKGMEFVDHREYTPGDDFRDIDWNLYARFERFLIRLYEEESQLLIYLLTDVSPSMAGGTPPKKDLLVRLATAMTFIAASNLDRVRVYPFGRELYPPLVPGRVKGGALSVMHRLSAMVEGVRSRTDILKVVKGFLDVVKEKGIVVIISDFLSSTPWRDAISYLMASGFEVAGVQILAPGETEPPEKGEVNLFDSETGEEIPLRLTPLLLRRYMEQLKSQGVEMERFMKGRGSFFVRVGSDTPVEDVILGAMRRGHFLG